ncbi:MAG: sugar transferase [Butyrivibrio sp.]|nr:sugar transferase [Butyrivibrio sp.]
MDLAPILLFAYCRLDKTKRCIEALERNVLAQYSELYIFADGAKGKDDMELVRSVQDWLRGYVSESQSFLKIHLEIKETNCGLANSIISGVSKVIEVYGEVIVLEDDIIASPFFLNYMNDGLDYYRNNTQIWSITSFGGYNLQSLKEYKHDIFVSYRACSWGWGSWRDRWNMVDWQVSDFNELSHDKEMQKHFNRGGGDLYGMLRRQMDGKIDSWAIRWAYSSSKKNMYTVYPRKGFAYNIGFDGSGVHCSKKSKYNNIIADEYDVKFEDVDLDAAITKEVYRYNTDNKIKKTIGQIKKYIRNRCDKLLESRKA